MIRTERGPDGQTTKWIEKHCGFCAEMKDGGICPLCRSEQARAAPEHKPRSWESLCRGVAERAEGRLGSYRHPSGIDASLQTIVHLRLGMARMAGHSYAQSIRQVARHLRDLAREHKARSRTDIHDALMRKRDDLEALVAYEESE